MSPASSAVVAALPAGVATPNFWKSSLAWYSWMFIATGLWLRLLHGEKNRKDRACGRRGGAGASETRAGPQGASRSFFHESGQIRRKRGCKGGRRKAAGGRRSATAGGRPGDARNGQPVGVQRVAVEQEEAGERGRPAGVDEFAGSNLRPGRRFYRRRPGARCDARCTRIWCMPAGFRHGAHEREALAVALEAPHAPRTASVPARRRGGSSA